MLRRDSPIRASSGGSWNWFHQWTSTVPCTAFPEFQTAGIGTFGWRRGGAAERKHPVTGRRMASSRTGNGLIALAGPGRDAVLGSPPPEKKPGDRSPDPPQRTQVFNPLLNGASGHTPWLNFFRFSVFPLSVQSVVGLRWVWCGSARLSDRRQRSEGSTVTHCHAIESTY